MTEVFFHELGLFSEGQCSAIKRSFEGKTFMKFHVIWSNMGGNCTLGVSTEDSATEEELHDFFLHCLIAFLGIMLQDE